VTLFRRTISVSEMGLVSVMRFLPGRGFPGGGAVSGRASGVPGDDGSERELLRRVHDSTGGGGGTDYRSGNVKGA